MTRIAESAANRIEYSIKNFEYLYTLTQKTDLLQIFSSNDPEKDLSYKAWQQKGYYLIFILT